ncbi:MAG: hypothetical protein VKJ46_10370 [Leptolyngbyaceae bacterium]|nr:hypothetical protein [Leptolyngbyaceae bacterium]
MEDATFEIFLSLAGIWIVLGGAILIALLKADGQPSRLGQWGLVVTLPIVIPFVAALTFAALYH